MKKLLLSSVIGASLWFNPSSFGMSLKDVQALKLTSHQMKIAPELIKVFGLPADTNVAAFSTNNLIIAKNLQDDDILDGSIDLESEFKEMMFNDSNPQKIEMEKNLVQCQQHKIYYEQICEQQKAKIINLSERGLISEKEKQDMINEIEQSLLPIEKMMNELSNQIEEISLESRVLKIVTTGERQSKLFKQQMLGFVIENRYWLEGFPSEFQFVEGNSWSARSRDAQITVGKTREKFFSPFGNFKDDDISSLYHEAGHVKDLFKINPFGIDQTMNLISKLFFISPEEKMRAIDRIKRSINLQKLKAELVKWKNDSSVASFEQSIRDINTIDELAADISHRWLDDLVNYAIFSFTSPEEVFQILGLRLIKGEDNKYYLVVNEESDFHFALEQGLPIRMWHWGKNSGEFGRLLDILLSPSLIRIGAIDALIRFYESNMPEYLGKLRTSGIPLSFRNALFNFYGHNSPVGCILRSQYSSLMSLLQNEYRLNAPLTGNWPLVCWQPSFVLPHFSVLH